MATNDLIKFFIGIQYLDVYSYNIRKNTGLMQEKRKKNRKQPSQVSSELKQLNNNIHL